MSESLPSLELLASEVRAERDAFTRHADAVDAKAGIILGFAGALVVLAGRRGDTVGIIGSALGMLAALVAAAVLWPQRFPTWDLRRLRGRYLTSDPRFTTVHLLDNAIAMVEQMREQLQVKVWRLKCSIVLLTLTAAAFLAGTIG